MVKLWRSFKALINGVWKIITLPCWLIIRLPQLFANEDTRSCALDVVKTLISAASFIAAVAAAIGLFVNYQDARQDRVDVRLYRQLIKEGLITDRY